MSIDFSKRNLDLILLRANKHLDPKSKEYADIVSAVSHANHFLKENSLLKEKLFDIEQSVSEEEKILNIIDAKLSLALLSNDKKTFLEINKPTNNDVWSIIIQKKFGHTPQQLLKKSEARRAKAIKKIINLRKENESLTDAISRLRFENNLFYKLKLGSPEEIINTREELQKLRNIVVAYINNFNSFIYRKELPNIHESWRAHLNEAWSRASISETKLYKANKELAALKKKKHPLSLIYSKKVKRGNINKRTKHPHL